VKLQDEAVANGGKCLIFLADLHAISLPHDPAELHASTLEMVATLVACGLDPNKTVLFNQAQVPAHAELQWLLNGTARMGWLNRMTQFKDKSERAEMVSAGLLNYPILQAADILLYHAELVPVGEDQRQHLEFTREIARKWNARFGEYFPEPQPMIGGGKRILGLDGVSKMSKSQNNTIPMLGAAEETWAAVRTAVTDPARVRKNDPGNPHVCNVYALHEFFTDPEEREEIEVRCQTARIGCVECKRMLADGISARLAPIRERARELRSHPDRVYEILSEGAERARAIARPILQTAYERMGLDPTAHD
jgi:tryptophanyl-tRNA synthetase